MEERHRIAVFIDFDNIEIGVKNTLRREFDVSPVLEALKERGEILTKIAYGDWTRHGQMSRSLSQHGVQMVQRHPGPRGDKNGADINLSLDALEMALTKPHIDAFAIVSGDSDFISLVEKLKQYNKTVYVVGGKAFTSTILQRNCREFISYESLLGTPTPSASTQRPTRQMQSPRAPQQSPQQSPRSSAALPLSHVASLLYRTLEVIARREVTPQLGLLKSTMMQLDSTFTERDYGASSFRQFMEMLQKERMIEIKRVDGQLLVEQPAASVANPPADPLLQSEDALPILFRSLKVIDENDLWGELSFSEVKDYVQRVEPEFDEKRYGFSQFAELLNYAQDVGLVRLEPDADSIWRVRPGVQFSPSRDSYGPSRAAKHVPATTPMPAAVVIRPEAAPASLQGAPEIIAEASSSSKGAIAASPEAPKPRRRGGAAQPGRRGPSGGGRPRRGSSHSRSPRPPRPTAPPTEKE
ncbi:MAG: NYN domain-containing protein [Acidobacteria bacterium]|nr:NYN domain-containing protein [Acidobacteriota bacterium]